MANTRKPRDMESREQTGRKSDAWIQPSDLPTPNPVEGWAFRWIRTGSLGSADVRNVSRRFREGWVPVVASEHPELAAQSDVGSKYPDGLEIGGLLLCKIPVEAMERRDEHFDNLNQQAMQSVDRGFMQEHDPRMPKYNESTSRTQFRKG